VHGLLMSVCLCLLLYCCCYISDYFGQIGLCEPSSVFTHSTSPNGALDTARIVSARIAPGTIATCSSELGASLTISLYQSNVCEVGRGFETLSLQRRNGLGSGMQQFVTFARSKSRVLCHTLRLNRDQSTVELRVTGQDVAAVWLTVAADGWCALVAPPVPPPTM
jgi:hypothetical protein